MKCELAKLETGANTEQLGREALATEQEPNRCDKDVSNYAKITGKGHWDLFALKALRGEIEIESTTAKTGILSEKTAPDGTTGATFTTNVWKKIEQTKVPTGENGRQTLMEISTLATAEDVEKALKRLLLHRQKTEQEDQQKSSKKSSEEQNKECSKKQEMIAKENASSKGKFANPKRKGREKKRKITKLLQLVQGKNK
uniref:Variant surface glycoprotein n=1 Tax=Trypanosoma brucei TaxID=5691 RepID=A0A1V0FYJ9_9TRYP|nr:variant surface glycoprotein [Trypanosoma brucei]